MKHCQCGRGWSAIAWGVLGVLCLQPAWSTRLLGQAPTATVSGRVTNEGAPLFAEVHLIGGTRTETDPEGRYRLSDLAPGRVALVFRSIGYRMERRTLDLVAGQEVVVDVSMSQSPVTLDGVVITATRDSVPLLEAPAAVSVVTADAIERRAVVLQGEELQGLPSLRVTQDTEGETAQLTVRGVPNRHMNDTFLALLDGVPMVSGSDEVDLGQLVPTSLVGRVEVVRGPVSALYGRGGIAGAVNYITVSPGDAPRYEFGVAPGSYGYVRPFAAVALPTANGRNHFLASAFYEHKDGWRAQSARDQLSVFLKDEWRATSRFTATLSASYQKLERGVAAALPVRSDGTPIPVGVGTDGNLTVANSSADRENWFTSVQLQGQISPAITLRGMVHVRGTSGESNLGFYDSVDEPSATIAVNGFRGPGHSRTVFVEPQLSWRVSPSLHVTSGVSYEHVGGHADEYWTGEFGFNPQFGFQFYTQRLDYNTGRFTNRASWITDRLLDAEYDADILAGYVQAEVDLTSRARIIAGLRYDRFARAADFGETTSGGVPQPRAHAADASDHLSPKLALTYRLGSLAAFASYGRGFSPAFGPVWAFRGWRTDLEPEIADNYEIGFKGTAFDGTLAFTTAAFLLARRDLLVLRPQIGGFTLPENAGEQRAAGAEVELRADLAVLVPGLQVTGSYSFTRSKWEDYSYVAEFSPDTVTLTGNWVAGVPRHLFSLGVDQEFSPVVGVGAWFNYVGTYHFDNANSARGGDYGLLNASVSVRPRFAPGLEARLAGLNILDHEYFVIHGNDAAPTHGYPGRPFELVATFTYRH